MPRFRFVVMTNPVEGQEAAYNDWYDNTHIPDLCAIPGVTGATRARLVESLLPSPRDYVAFYEMDTPDPHSVMAEIGRRVGSGQMVISPALDRDSVVTTLYEMRPDAPA